MKKILACAILSLSFTPAAYADDYKKSYCSNQEYVTQGSKYPHLHCAKDFYVYSESSSNHKYMAQGSEIYCERTRAAIDDVKARGPNGVIGYQQVLDSLLSFARVYCKK
ncbi:hypothetical protein [Janthinobacterium agaricidamnosum]|uniref:Lipoprotein n=1 Tax=Janthinobacterium agaricidamnosum NBRC 102515 = DSM 9628 TaxID=1349767 RepID=W0V2S6_9BURK|nr:hypothetical protein [Janthinobacterium agaricidamnosum]CDG81653.1 hypothetical protein GJA_998 [Janthinobacterium agaricidamnosum NBRC 102515 = DSM 9628]